MSRSPRKFPGSLFYQTRGQVESLVPGRLRSLAAGPDQSGLRESRRPDEGVGGKSRAFLAAEG